MQDAPVSNFGLSAVYALTPSTVLEASVGRSRNELAGCAQGQSSSSAIFCDGAVPMNAAASLTGSGLSSLPLLFPEATTLNSGYYARNVMDELRPAFWDGSRMAMVLHCPCTANSSWLAAPPMTPSKSFNIASMGSRPRFSQASSSHWLCSLREK